MSLKIYIILSITCLFPIIATSANLNCLNNSGQNVAWWAALKYPEGVASRHAYTDSVSTKSAFSIINGYVDAENQALDNTINLINSIEGLSLLVFNDENPDGETTFTGAHAKGIIAYDNTENIAIWLMHSAPKYPTVSDEGKISVALPHNSLEFGQNFFCATLNLTNVTSLLQNIETAQLNSYYKSGVFEDDENTLGSNTFTINEFSLIDGNLITLLTKAPSYNQYLYEGIIEPHFKTSLMVESWGRPWMADQCGPKYDAVNIVSIMLSNGDSWDSSDDHSKWGVSYNSQTNIACPADMNRMKSQISRGGNAFCIQNNNLFEAFTSIVSSYSKCSTEDFIIGFLY